MSGRVRVWLVLLAVLLAALGTAGALLLREDNPRPQRVVGAVEGQRLYVNPEGHVPRQRAAWLRGGRPELARALEPLLQPTATWLTGEQAEPFQQTVDLTKAAAAKGELPVLVVYNLPERDCGQYSSGGASSIDAYLTWLGSLAAGIGSRPALIILEPDAVPHALEGCTGSRPADERYRLLTEAVKILKKQPAVRVYLDAGNASWVDDTATLARGLQASGLASADGFALNTANFETTQRSHAYGQEVSNQAGGKHFVIDTSRNGAGPPPGSGTGGHHSWCNPTSARLGPKPTTSPGLEKVDALLWVKQPGDSDGTCQPGDKPAGQFTLKYVSQLLGKPMALQQ